MESDLGAARLSAARLGAGRAGASRCRRRVLDPLQPATAPSSHATDRERNAKSGTHSTKA
eukprot:395040-Rhodomonas_salina.8